MTRTHDAMEQRERAIDLLADRAIVGLDGDESLELDRLLLAHPDLDEGWLDVIAAALMTLAPGIANLASSDAHSRAEAIPAPTHSGQTGASAIPHVMPDQFRERLVAMGEAWVNLRGVRQHPLVDRRRDERTLEVARPLPQRTVATGSAGTRGRDSRARRLLPLAALLGWSAAAAAALIAMVAWWPRFSTHQSIAAQRAELIASAPDLVKVHWTETGHEFVESCVRGDIVFSTAEQRGYMLIGGLRSNDPTEFQYQLWIFDATREEAYPIDGGVFDVPEIVPGGIVIIPVMPGVAVREPTLFAVTVEPPGGVVVSKRDIAILASAGE